MFERLFEGLFPPAVIIIIGMGIAVAAFAQGIDGFGARMAAICGIFMVLAAMNAAVAPE